jgi:hypothetical protein
MEFSLYIYTCLVPIGSTTKVHVYMPRDFSHSSRTYWKVDTNILYMTSNSTGVFIFWEFRTGSIFILACPRRLLRISLMM